MSGWTTCLRCGLEGYDIAPLAGRRWKDGSPGRRAYCRWCLADPKFKAEPVKVRLIARREWMRRWRANEAKVVLGPARCMSCRRWVIWNGWNWRAPSGNEHRCGKGRHVVEKSVDEPAS